jgi:hypothetical protein
MAATGSEIRPLLPTFGPASSESGSYEKHACHHWDPGPGRAGAGSLIESICANQLTGAVRLNEPLMIAYILQWGTDRPHRHCQRPQ